MSERERGATADRTDGVRSGPSDDAPPEGSRAGSVPDGGTRSQQDDFDPVEVFPEAEAMDLRPGADACYKCSTCDTNCPVAAVDDSFPGPRFQGPEQWRLTRRGEEGGSPLGTADPSGLGAADVDPSVMQCSNCMRCDHACPTGVPLSQMHNAARGRYVAEQLPRLSRKYVRNRLLSNYGTLARLASYAPRLTNRLLRSRVVKAFNRHVLGITSERELPAFASEPFTTWWTARGGSQVSSVEKRVAYFHGDYANYNTPGVAKATVRVFEHFGYEVVVPDQRCSGTPMLANGMLADARRAARFNVETLHELVEAGYDVVCSCTSCSMALRTEYPELFDDDGTSVVAAHTYDAVEYLRMHEDLEGVLAATGHADLPDFAYHAPCHARNQGLDGQATEVVGAIDDVNVYDVGDSCSGISGTYGWKAERYETSMAIGRDMFEHMETVDAEVGLTECPTCAMQMAHGTGYEIRHPLEVLATVLVDRPDGVVDGA